MSHRKGNKGGQHRDIQFYTFHPINIGSCPAAGSNVVPGGMLTHCRIINKRKASGKWLMTKSRVCGFALQDNADSHDLDCELTLSWPNMLG